MARLGLADNDLVLVRQTALPKATYVKFQAHTSDFAAVSNPRVL
jgi:ubiquitin fusion degradation protein 1